MSRSALGRKRPALVLAAMGTIVAMALGTVAFAHGIVVWAERHGDQVAIEAHLTDGNAVSNAPLQVVDQDGLVVIEGRTDDAGTFRFDDPTRAPVTIRVRLDNEHIGSFELKGEE